MIRSMYSAVSGLKGHQTRMDVVGNNIANVNTTGFKASRVTFADMISQNLSGASSPTGTIGGVNPKQIGLGMSVAATDLLYTNGSVQQTGKNTDVAISRGDGLFIVSKGNEKYYTRNGAFSFDAEGNLTLPSTGLYVQGYMGTNGRINIAGDNTTKIQIPAGKSMEATTTATANYTKNLNATTPGYEVANVLVRYADGTSATVSTYSATEKGRYTLHMSTGEKIKLNQTTPTLQTVGSAPTGTLYTSKMTGVTAVGTGTVDLTLATDHPADPSSPVAIVGLPATYSPASGTFQVGDRYTLTGTITAAVTNSPSPGLTRLTLANASPAGVTQVDVPNPTTFTYAINDVYTGSLKINKIEAKTGAIVSSADGNSIKVAANVTPAFDDTHTDFECLNTYVSGTIQATERSTEYQHNNKFVNDIILNTRSGTALSGLVAATYSAGNTFYPSVTTTVAVYDSLGAKHSVPVVFTKQENNKWKLTLGTGSDAFEITDPDGTKTAVGLTKTELKFDTSGAYISGSASLKLSYSNGAAPQQVSLNLAAITQYSGTSTIAADSDGNAAGTLSNVDIDSQGVITGTYTNGVRQKEAQIAMAQFNNPSGLTKLGGNLYQESNNTGTRTISGAADIGTELTTSALEMANVDLADQFSDMIITQRGFQSNSKMITVSDEMLETLINMKR